MDDANVWWCPSSMYCPSPGMTRPSLRSSHRYTGTFISSPTPAVASFNLRLSRSTLSLIELGTPSRLGPASFASAVRSTTQSLPLLPTATWGAGAAVAILAAILAAPAGTFGAVVAAGAAAAVCAWFSTRKLGGYTGDTLGAAQQVAEILALAAIAAALSHPMD